MPYNKFTGEGNGFSVKENDGRDMLHVIRDACALYKEKEAWDKLVVSGMACNFSWEKPAEEYVKLYSLLIPIKV